MANNYTGRGGRVIRPKLVPYKLWCVLLYARLDGLIRTPGPDGILVEARVSALADACQCRPNRVESYLSFLINRGHATLIERRRGFVSVSLPPPSAWPLPGAAEGAGVGTDDGGLT